MDEVRTRRDYFRKMFRGAIRTYLRPGFHPDQEDNYHLAEAYLTSIGRRAA